MKAIKHIALFLLILPLFSVTGGERDSKADTVIIEINENSKIVIYTKSRADLSALQGYDINQMIRDLNAQLGDSVEYLVIENERGTTYVDDERTNRDDIDGLRLDLGGLQVQVDPDELEDFDEDDWYRRKKVSYDVERADRTTHHFNIDIGLNNWVEDGQFPDANNSPYSIKPFGSWYVGLNSTNRTWVTGPIFIEWGMGINWYNWKLQDPDFQFIETDTNTDLFLDPNRSGRKSKLTASYINATFVPMFDFSRGRKRVTNIEAEGIRIKRYSKKGIRFGLGGYVGYRLGSRSKFVFEENGDRDRIKERDNFYLENLRYGLRAQVGWKGVELFGMYDLNEVFNKDRGPSDSPGLNAVTFGITL